MNKYKFIILILSILLLSNSTVLAQEYHWEVVTNLNDVQKLMLDDGKLYCASSGGLIVYNLDTDTYDSWNAEDDWSDQYLTAINKTERGHIVLGTYNGSIIFFNPETYQFHEDLALDGNRVMAIEAIGDTLWVAGTDIVAVYLYDHELEQYSFRDFFTNFNYSVGQFHDIYYFENKIWVGSDVGLFSASGNFILNNLKAGESWQRKTNLDGLPENKILSLNSRNDTLLIGTTNGLAFYSNGQFSFNYAGLAGRDVKEIKLVNDEIYINNYYGIYHYQNNAFQSVYTYSKKIVNSFAVYNGNTFWAALSENGIKDLTNNFGIRFNGIIENNVAEPLLDSFGRLWISSGSYKDERRKGFSVRLTDGTWKNYRYLNSWASTSSSQCFMEDTDGNIWIGTWNGGIVIFDPDLNIQHINNYTTDGLLWISSYSESDTVIVHPPDSLRHIISHTRSAPDLLVVTDIMLDNRDNTNKIWLLASEVQSGLPLVNLNQNALNDAIFDSLSWQRIAYPYNYSTNDQSAAITQDIFGNIWIGTETSGVIGMILTDPNNPQWIHLEEKDDLKNIRVWTIAGDLDGYVWIGTFGGLNAYFNGKLFNFSGDAQPIGVRINKIFVDSENNKWFATDKGVSLLRASGSPWDDSSWEHFVPNNSELFGDNIHHTNLPSEEIRGIFVDNKTGDVYCGTESGLAILRNNPFTTPLEDLSEIKAGPNPFKIHKNSTNYFFLRNLTTNSEVKILTSTGRLVKNLDKKDILGSLARWNGMNEQGELVSSGVYLYLITDEDGNADQGKFLVIHE